MSVKSAVEQLILDLEDNRYNLSLLSLSAILLANINKATYILADIIDPSKTLDWFVIKDIFYKMSAEEKKELYRKMISYAELITFE